MLDAAACADALADHGWLTLPSAVTADDARAIRAEIDHAFAARDLRPARTGRGSGETVRTDVRRDLIAWLEPALLARAPALASFRARMQALGAALGAGLRIPVAEFDGHITRYPPQGFYRPHVDAPLGASRRLISVVLYLDDDWCGEHGGELRMWPLPSDAAPDADAPSVTIEPRLGTLVLFRSAGIWHQVCPTRVPRSSVTGWFLSSI